MNGSITIKMEKFNKNQLTTLFNKEAANFNHSNPLKTIKCYKNQKTLIVNALNYFFKNQDILCIK